MPDGELRASRRGSKCNLHLGWLLAAGRDIKVQQYPLRKLPGSNAPELHLASVPRAFIEPSTCQQKYLARRVLRVTTIGRPPLSDLLCEEFERSTGGQGQEHGLHDHRRASSSMLASAVSQKSSRNSRTLAKPCIRME